MTLKANEHCCEEASLHSREVYMPCNAPAKLIVGWRGRTDAPIRMCEGCADHNCKNRGGYVVGPYPPPPPKAAPRKQAPDQRKTFTAAEISSCEDDLAREHIAILRAALTGADYQAIGNALALRQGTVKSRLSRARESLSAALARKAAAP